MCRQPWHIPFINLYHGRFGGNRSDVNCLGTGHYLSPEGGGGGAGEERCGGFWGITWFLEEQKGGSVLTEKRKGGVTENFGRIQRGGTQISLENEDLRGGDRESHQMFLGGITSVK